MSEYFWNEWAGDKIWNLVDAWYLNQEIKNLREKAVTAHKLLIVSGNCPTSLDLGFLELGDRSQLTYI